MNKRENLFGWVYYFKKGGVFDQLRHLKGPKLFLEPVERNPRRERLIDYPLTLIQKLMGVFWIGEGTLIVFPKPVVAVFGYKAIHGIG